MNRLKKTTALLLVFLILFISFPAVAAKNNANPEPTDPIDELMPYAEQMEKTEDDLLTEKLREKMLEEIETQLKYLEDRIMEK